MPSLSQQDLKAMAAEAQGPALSLFMPTHRAGPPVAQDPSWPRSWPRAHQGRIATLFVPRGSKRWGRYRFDRLSVQEQEREEPGDEDLLDLAASQTFLRGGTPRTRCPMESNSPPSTVFDHRYRDTQRIEAWTYKSKGDTRPSPPN
jgi:hypothetical protein